MFENGLELVENLLQIKCILP